MAKNISPPTLRPFLAFRAFVRWLDRFSNDPGCKLILPTPDLFHAGTELFRERPDKAWSLTDCLSFVTMQHEGLTDALTADFIPRLTSTPQAGFNAILGQSAK